MKATQQYKELHNVEIMKEKQNESDDTRIYEILSKYSIWFMKNNIEEFQMFSKFWNQQYIALYEQITYNRNNER